MIVPYQRLLARYFLRIRRRIVLINRKLDLFYRSIN